jgi:hypothetical protein
LAKKVNGRDRKAGLAPLSIQRLFSLGVELGRDYAAPLFSFEVVRSAFHEECAAATKAPKAECVGEFLAASPNRTYGLVCELTASFAAAVRPCVQMVVMKALSFLVGQLLAQGAEEVATIVFSHQALLQALLCLGLRGAASANVEVAGKACATVGKMIDRLREVAPKLLGAHLQRILEVLAPLVVTPGTHDTIVKHTLLLLDKAITKGASIPALTIPLTMLSELPSAPMFDKMNSAMRKLRGELTLLEVLERFLCNAGGDGGTVQSAHGSTGVLSLEEPLLVCGVACLP